MNTPTKIDLNLIKISPNFTDFLSYPSFLWSNFNKFGFILKLSILCICLFWFEVSIICVSLLIFVQIFYYFEALWVTLISYILIHKFLTIFDSQTLKLVFFRSSLSHNLLLPFGCCSSFIKFYILRVYRWLHFFLDNNEQVSHLI